MTLLTLYSLLLTLIFASPAMSATYWVRPAGTMAGCTASASAPASDAGYKSTIATGLACLSSGDTLNVRAGTYSEGITGSQLVSGSSWNTATTIQAYGSEQVIITGGLNIAAPGAGTVKEYIIFRGGGSAGAHNLIFDGPNQQYVNGISIGGGGTGGDSGEARYIRIDNVEVKNVNGSDCIAIGGANQPPYVVGHHLEILNSYIHNCGDFANAFGHAIYITTNDNLIENNLVTDSNGWGIHAHYSGPTSIQVHRNKIYRNVVHDVCHARVSCDGIVVGQGSDNEIVNNVVYNVYGLNKDGGVGISADSDDTLIYSNTVYNTTWYGINTYGGNRAQIKNNLLFTVNTANGGAAMSNLYDSAPTYAANFCNAAGTGCAIASAVNPFVNAAAGNFRLNACSGPTCPNNNGVDLGISYNTDIAAIHRPQGSGWDIGAYEYQAATLPTIVINLPAGCTGTASACTTSSQQITITGTSSLP